MTNRVLISFPEVEKSLESIPETGVSKTPPQGCIWFSDEPDREFWCRFLGQQSFDEALVCTGGYTLRLKVITGPASLNQLGAETIRLLYLPREGASDAALNRWLNRHSSEAPYYFLRLFRRDELGTYQREVSPLKQIWRSVRAEFGFSPFLGLDDEETLRGLKEWLARIVVLSNMRLKQPLLEQHLRRVAARAQEVGEIWTDTPEELNEKSELINLLALRDYGRSLLDSIQRCENDRELVENCLSEYPYHLDSIAHEHCKASGKKVFGVEFIINLGDELLPELQRLMLALSPFADELIKSSLSFLKPLGEELKEKLKISTPILALIGPYSSGKTTLLNLLLMEKGA
ncbi:MAG TPA: hypothetical protein VF766_04845, partial [Pyrinomonadaceae bacterium]